MKYLLYIVALVLSLFLYCLSLDSLALLFPLRHPDYALGLQIRFGLLCMFLLMTLSVFFYEFVKKKIAFFIFVLLSLFFVFFFYNLRVYYPYRFLAFLIISWIVYIIFIMSLILIKQYFMKK